MHFWYFFLFPASVVTIPIFTGVALKSFLSFDKCMSEWLTDAKDKMDNDIDKLGITFYGKTQRQAYWARRLYINTLEPWLDEFLLLIALEW